METRHQNQDEVLAEWAVIQGAQQNPALFAPLYSKYFKPIYLFVLRRTGQEHIADDLCGLVFSKALTKLPQYTFKGVPFSAWLYAIALNEIQLFYRQTKKERVVSISSESLDLLSKDIVSEEYVDALEEREKKLLNALGQLNTEEMLYIEMRFFEQRSFKEIAEIQHITENNAKVKTYRIIERLRKLILHKK